MIIPFPLHYHVQLLQSPTLYAVVSRSPWTADVVWQLIFENLIYVHNLILSLMPMSRSMCHFCPWIQHKSQTNSIVLYSFQNQWLKLSQKITWAIIVDLHHLIFFLFLISLLYLVLYTPISSMRMVSSTFIHTY